ncbi:MAG TPA: CAP domain-containing protein [Lachnospiraceae bacterium]|nr:CAP domain-containing protein [Lachnospiraceae bacterium]
MKKTLLKFISKALVLALITSSVVLSYEGINVYAKTNVETQSDGETVSVNTIVEKVTRTVKTQRELYAALKDETIDIIVVKPTRTTQFYIPSQTYDKDLVVYQAYTNINNKGNFDKTMVYVSTQYQLNKCIRIKNIDTIVLQTERKTNFVLSKGNTEAALVIEAPNSNITNKVTWKNVVINNMINSTWNEKGTNNDILISGDTLQIVVDKNSTVNSLTVNQTVFNEIATVPVQKNGLIQTGATTAPVNQVLSRALNIKADGIVTNVVLQTDSAIQLTGRSTDTFMNNVLNESKKAITINVNAKPIEVATIITPEVPKVKEIKATPAPVVSYPSSSGSSTPSTPVHSHTYTSKIITDSTCTETGIRKYTCSSCGNTYTSVIQTKDHVLGDWEVTTLPTYTATGLKIQKCTVCDEIINTEAIAKLTHTHDYISSLTTPATCEDDGLLTYTCSVCGDTYTEIIPATGHEYTSEITTPATCTETGLITYTCSVCGDTYTEIIPTIAHNHISEITTPATCTSVGLITYTCSECGDSYTEEIPMIAHNYISEITTPATYTLEGLITYTCSECGDIYTEVIPVIAHTHDYVSELTNPATCITDGFMTYTCSVCGDIYTELIPLTGHTLGDWEIISPAIEGSDGLQVQKCTICNEVQNTEVIPMLVHMHDYMGEVTTPTTCTENGVMTYTCLTCSDTFTEVILTTGHTLGEWEVTAEANVVSDGTRVQKCTICNEVINTEVIPNLSNTVSEIKTVDLEVVEGSLEWFDPVNDTATGRDNYSLAYEVFLAVNAERTSLGLNTLTWDTTMDDYTQLRAAEITQKFSHERPNLERGYEMNDTISSENVAHGFATSQQVMDAWKASPGHYAAIVNPDNVSVAVGCFEEEVSPGEYHTGWVQFFHIDNLIIE